MSDLTNPAAAWRKAETYQALLDADPAVWAWEFARRGLVAQAKEPSGQADRATPPELCFVDDGPVGEVLPAPLWRWQADKAMPVFSAEPARPGRRAGLDLARLDVASLVVRTADGHQHVMISDGARRLRFAVVRGEVLAGPTALCFHLPSPGLGPVALDALGGLIALRDTGRLPPAKPRPPAKAARWLAILRAHDARRAGASQRQIALMLFGEARVREDWNGRSDYMRMRVQRLVRAAEDTVAGGYRALLGLRSLPRDRPGIVQVWRSPAWRGGDFRRA